MGEAAGGGGAKAPRGVLGAGLQLRGQGTGEGPNFRLNADGLGRRIGGTEDAGIDVDVDQGLVRDQVRVPKGSHLPEARSQNEGVVRPLGSQVVVDGGVASQAGNPEEERMVFGKDTFAPRAADDGTL